MESVLVTGVAGNLGRRLLPQLAGMRVIGVDFVEPRGEQPARFVRMDLGVEDSCPGLVKLIREEQPACVIHLAFVLDAVRTGVLDPERMWQINVAGTARVMEAITEAGRRGVEVRKFIFPSSVSAYGPNLPGPVKEDFPLGGHSLPYAIHKRECDLVVQQRAASISPCRTFILRPHIFVGPSVENYLVAGLRGTPSGAGLRAQRMRERGKRLPMIVPWGDKYLRHRCQFVHVDDVARLLAWIVRRPDAGPQVTILNVGGRGIPPSLGRCAEIAGAKLVQLPTRALARLALEITWRMGISGFPPEAFPYLTGEYIMDLGNLQRFLGADFERVIRYTVEDAVRESVRREPAAATATALAT
ncbi:MAG TPA: NAD-dependent epimerase/dehydratase family protein [Terriglobales bacterium]|nr:NAD-dependent epimerase/dehydratase family protein [Terriglobales bacterium]